VVTEADCMYCEEQNRQLSLEIWGKVYAREMERQVDRILEFYQKIGEEPRITDYASFEKWQSAAKTYHANHDVRYNYIRSIPREKAEAAAIRGTLMSWNRIRKIVWERDGGTCQVCGEILEWDYWGWECGHIVDRCMGGSDRPSNLEVMCYWCNHRKPPHKTKAEYYEWVKNGGVITEIGPKIPSAIEVLRKDGAIETKQICEEQIRGISLKLFYSWLFLACGVFEVGLPSPEWQQRHIDKIATLIRAETEERNRENEVSVRTGG
jgi:5-methylcytosine-specific restriction endonuclease McrA